jgi:hypothetical protein
MRTTVNIQDDVLIIAKNMARQEGKSVGDMLSELVRRAIQATVKSAKSDPSLKQIEIDLKKLGVTPYYAPNGKTYTDDLVDEMRREQGI